MSKEFYIGFRIEIANKYIVRNFTRKFNTAKNPKTKILDLFKDGKIIIEKKKDMLIAHGAKAEKDREGLTNFALLTSIGKDKDNMNRLIKIINVLGNDRLIREKISVFVQGKSILNGLPELNPIRTAMIRIESIAPGFMHNGWYYAPEFIIVTL
jgi:hypothetical protein